MPRVEVVFYRAADGSVPVKRWLETLRHKDRKAFAKCVARIQLLADFGHELRRPHADTLRDGIRELRARCGRVNYRILYFFDRKGTAVLVEGLKKGRKVSSVAIDRAIRRKAAVAREPALHVFEDDICE